MKAVLISVKPKWCELIAQGKKTVEVRKTKPKIDVPFKCYIYCTQNVKSLIKDDTSTTISFIAKNSGKVIGEFVCDRIYHIKNLDTKFTIDNDEKLTNNIALASCLDFVDMKKYLGNKDGYAWHIIDLVIYDKPKDLSEFKRIGFMTEEQWLYNLYPNTHCHYEAWAKKFEIERPPQSWCYALEVS